MSGIYFIKNQIKVDPDVVHCLVCDVCIPQWDHHCFWLNSCISLENKCKFKLFLTLAGGALAFNFIFFTISKSKILL